MRVMDRLSSLAREDRADLGPTLTEFYFYQPGIL
jgi:hypothetical protein